MDARVRKYKAQLKTAKGVKMQIELPLDLYHRIKALCITDGERSGHVIWGRDKALEALLLGIETLESREREL